MPEFSKMLGGREELDKLRALLRVGLDRVLEGAQDVPRLVYDASQAQARDYVQEMEGGERYEGYLPTYEQARETLLPGYYANITRPAEEARKNPVLAGGEAALDATQLAQLLIALPRLSKLRKSFATSDPRRLVTPEELDLNKYIPEMVGSYGRTLETELTPGQFSDEARRTAGSRTGVSPSFPVSMAAKADADVQQMGAGVVHTRPIRVGDGFVPRPVPGPVDREKIPLPMLEIAGGYRNQRELDPEYMAMLGNDEGGKVSYLQMAQHLANPNARVLPFTGVPARIGDIGQDPYAAGALASNLTHNLHLKGDFLLTSEMNPVGLRPMFGMAPRNAGSIAPLWGASKGPLPYMPRELLSMSLDRIEDPVKTTKHETGHALAMLSYMNDPEFLHTILGPEKLAEMYSDAFEYTLGSRTGVIDRIARKAGNASTDEDYKSLGEMIDYIQSVSEVTGEGAVPLIEDFEGNRRAMPTWAEVFRDFITESPAVKPRLDWSKR